MSLPGFAALLRALATAGRSEQRQMTIENDSLPKCAVSLLELLKRKHVTCIAEAQASANLAAAAASFNNTCFGSMMKDAHVKARAERLSKQITQAKMELGEPLVRWLPPWARARRRTDGDLLLRGL